jgi:hypothetical protein
VTDKNLQCAPTPWEPQVESVEALLASGPGDWVTLKASSDVQVWVLFLGRVPWFVLLRV